MNNNYSGDGLMDDAKPAYGPNAQPSLIFRPTYVFWVIDLFPNPWRDLFFLSCVRV